MLASVTEKMADHSTKAFFCFTFFCDLCGNSWESPRYQFSMQNEPLTSRAEQAAREILWKSEHDAAYERANNEAILHFNRCPQCGRRVCDDCFDELDIICTSCKTKKQEGSASSHA